MTQAMTGASIPDRRTTDQARSAKSQSRAPARNLVFVTRNVPPGIGEHLTRAGLTVAPFQPGAILAALTDDTAPCAILWADPTSRLTEALEQGTDPVAVISAWQDEAQAVLAVFRRNRRRLTLIEAQALISELGQPDRVFLRERLDCPDLPLPLGPDTQAKDPQAGPSLAAMIAAAIVPRIADIQDSLNELQGSGICALQSDMPASAISAMADELGRRQAQAAAELAAEREAGQRRDAEHAEDLSLLRAELALQQQRAEGARTAAEGRLRALEAESRTAAQEAGRALEAARAEGARLGAALAARDEELAKTIARGKARDQAVTQAAAELVAEREAAEAEVARLGEELAETIARGKARDQALAQAAAELVAEREAAEAEVARLGEELARAVTELAAEREAGQRRQEGSAREQSLLRTQIALQQQEAEQARTSAESRLRAVWAEGRQAAIEAERALMRALADLRTEASARRTAERQREKILESTSWRVTRPIRQIKTMIAGGKKSIDVKVAEERLRLPKS